MARQGIELPVPCAVKVECIKHVRGRRPIKHATSECQATKGTALCIRKCMQNLIASAIRIHLEETSVEVVPHRTRGPEQDIPRYYYFPVRIAAVGQVEAVKIGESVSVSAHSK